MFETLSKWIARIFWIGSGILFLIFILQMLQFFLAFHSVNPLGAWIFSGFVFGVIILTLVWVYVKLSGYPRVLKAPTFIPGQEKTHREMVKYCRYLKKYLVRLSGNQHIDEDQALLAKNAILEIDSCLGAHPLNDDLKRCILKTETEIIAPILSALKEKSSYEVRKCVRDVMLAVTFSPYQSIDILVVTYRNLMMVIRIISIYSSRPRFREQWNIVKDTFKVVITVNFIAAGRSLVESLFSHLPFLGRIVDDIAQGLGAGYLTSASGYAAIERCAAFRGWDQLEARQNLTSNARAFLGDVRDIFTKDVLPNLRTKISLSVPKDLSENPGFWESIKSGINKTVETSIEATDFLFIKPVTATGETIGKGVSVTKSGIKEMFSYLNMFKS